MVYHRIVLDNSCQSMPKNFTSIVYFLVRHSMLVSHLAICLSPQQNRYTGLFGAFSILACESLIQVLVANWLSSIKIYRGFNACNHIHVRINVAVLRGPELILISC
jgi:hypothetical protein